MSKAKRPVLPWLRLTAEKSPAPQRKKARKIKGFTIRKKHLLPPISVPDLYVLK